MKQNDESQTCCSKHSCKSSSPCGGSGAIYGLGVVGALFYFLQDANTFVLVITGIGKAFFWPAILMFKLLTYLQM